MLVVAVVQRKHGHAVGGPYVAVHLRRRDFLYSHKKTVPSLDGAAEQIESALLRYNMDTAFVATDAPPAGKFVIQGQPQYAENALMSACDYSVCPSICLSVRLSRGQIVMKLYSSCVNKFDISGKLDHFV
jgi:hypothetical protein